MKSKKTFDVQLFKNEVNERLARAYKATTNEIYNSNDYCASLCSILEDVLHNSGNYKGYQSLHWLNGGCNRWEIDGKPDFPMKNHYINGGKEYCRYYY